jgi:hypothetical protein
MALSLGARMERGNDNDCLTDSLLVRLDGYIMAILISINRPINGLAARPFNPYPVGKGILTPEFPCRILKDF